MTRIRISAIAQLQKSPITASSENVPDSQYSAYRRKYYNIFKQNVLSAHNRKIQITELILVTIRNHGKISRSKPQQIFLTGVHVTYRQLS